MTFIIVDRNAIHDNDRDGLDRPTVVVYGCSCMPPETAHEVEIRVGGKVVGRFKSQSAKRPIDPKRPHVWFELEPNAGAVAVPVRLFGV